MLDKNFDVEEELHRGPKRDRSCTDVLFCLGFVLFWGLCLFMTFSLLSTAEFSKIARPYDSDKIACGFNANKDYPLLYFGRIKGTKVGEHTMKRRICVKECPTKEGKLQNCRLTQFWKEKYSVKSCDELRAYETYLLWDRFCLPYDQAFLNKINKSFNGIDIQKVIEDVDKVKFLILASIFASFVFCFVYSFFLEHCTWLIVIISFIAFYAGCIYISIFSWNRYKKLREIAAEDDDPSTKADESGKFFKWIAYIMWATIAVISLIICCLFSRIKLAVEVIMVITIINASKGRS